MSGRRSRNKGANGEREVARILGGVRVAQLQSRKGSTDPDVDWIPGLHIEVKRQERISILDWCHQAEEAVGYANGSEPSSARDSEDQLPPVPVVIFRKNREPWRVCLQLEDFVDLIKDE